MGSRERLQEPGPGEVCLVAYYVRVKYSALSLCTDSILIVRGCLHFIKRRLIEFLSEQRVESTVVYLLYLAADEKDKAYFKATSHTPLFSHMQSPHGPTRGELSLILSETPN